MPVLVPSACVLRESDGSRDGLSWVCLWNHAASLPLHPIGPGSYKVLLSFQGRKHRRPPPDGGMSRQQCKNSVWNWKYIDAAISETLSESRSPFFPNLVPPSNYCLMLQHTLHSWMIFLFSLFSWLHFLASYPEANAKEYFSHFLIPSDAFYLWSQNTLSMSISKSNDLCFCTTESFWRKLHYCVFWHHHHHYY